MDTANYEHNVIVVKPEVKCEDEDTQYVHVTSLSSTDVKHEPMNTPIFEDPSHLSPFQTSQQPSEQEPLLLDDANHNINPQKEQANTCEKEQGSQNFDSYEPRKSLDICDKVVKEVSTSMVLRKIKCSVCRSTFSSASPEVANTCPICTSAFAKVSSIITQGPRTTSPAPKKKVVKVVAKQKPFVCVVCNESFSRAGTLKIHLTKHSRQLCGQPEATQTKGWKCSQCEKAFADNVLLKKHLIVIHGEYQDIELTKAQSNPEKTFKCKICDQVFIFLGTLLRHYKTVHKSPTKHTGNDEDDRNHDPEKINKCNICGQVFSFLGTLRRHYYKVHMSQTKNSGNDEDDRSREASKSIIVSKIKHKQILDKNTGQLDIQESSSKSERKQRGPDKKTHQCDVCNKRFLSAFSLKCHQVKIHHVKCTGKIVRPTDKTKDQEECSTIKQSTSDKKDKVVKEKLHRCESCKQTFTRARSLTHHKKQCPQPNSGHQISKDQAIDKNGTSKTNNESIKNHSQDKQDASSCGIVVPDVNKKVVKEKPYKCDICEDRFSRVGTLNLHKKKHAGQHLPTKHMYDTVKCGLCRNTFMDASVLKKHLRSHIKRGKCFECGDTYYEDFTQPHFSLLDGVNQCKKCIIAQDGTTKCNLCDAAFTNYTEFCSHMTIHGKRYICGVCDQAFDAPNLVKHMQLHGRDPNNPQNKKYKKSYKCKACSETFTKATLLVDHMNSCHSKKPYKCTVCNEAFSQVFMHYNHMATCHGEKPHRCDVCDKSFTQNTTLIKHMTKYHGETPPKCTTCNKLFPQKTTAFYYHVAKCRKKKPHKCKMCARSFARPDELRSHIKTHTGEKPYKCDVCDMAFARRYSVKVHQRTHTGEKPYKCLLCSEAFAHNSGLKFHVLRHSRKKSLQCSKCDSVFFKKYELEAHMRTHRRKKPHKCKLCSKAYTTIYALWKHKQTHKAKLDQIKDQKIHSSM